MELKDIQKILQENNELTKKLLTNLGEAANLKKRISQNERTLNNELFGQLPTKYRFNDLEKIVYYFNRKKGVALNVIAEELGYTHDYIKQTSVRMNKKINKKSK